MASGGGIQGLVALFSDINSLEVPDFQRNYSWGEDQIDAFHQDVVFATASESDHFLGSVILMKTSTDEADKTYQVIDGQQRLTTIFVYLSILRDKVMALPSQQISPAGSLGTTIDVRSKANNMIFSDEESGQARFKSNALLRQFIYDHVFREPSPQRPVMPSQHKYFSLDLRKAHRRIGTLIEQELEKQQGDSEKLRFLWDTIKSFQNRLLILKITTSTYSESFDIFMTLNNRGLALGPSDLVKSLFMKHSASGLAGQQVIEKNQEISTIWKEITDNIGDGDIDQFLRHYLISKQSGTVQAKRIYKKVEDMINESERPAPAVDSPRESWRVIPLRGLLHVTKHPLLTRAT